jgi:hypothetical protein
MTGTADARMPREQHLFLSWRAVASQWARKAVGIIPIAVLAWFFWHVPGVVFLVGLAAGLLLFAFIAKKEIVVDSNGFSLIPLLPLIRRKLVRWDDVVDLIPKKTINGDVGVAYSLKPRNASRLWSWRRRKKWLGAWFAPGRGSPALGSEELAGLMNGWRQTDVQ